MLDQETFLKEHYIDPKEFRACGISWEELCAIYDSYVSIEDHLRDLGKEFVDAYLYDIETMTKKDGDKTVDTGGYNFGDYTFDRYYGGMRYSSLSSPNVTWEIATKHDLGIDFSFFNDKLSGSVDYFNEKREGIYMLREYLPGIVGLESNPSANVGKVTSEGFDGHFTFRQKLGAVGLTIRSKSEAKRS